MDISATGVWVETLRVSPNPPKTKDQPGLKSRVRAARAISHTTGSFAKTPVGQQCGTHVLPMGTSSAAHMGMPTYLVDPARVPHASFTATTLFCF